MACEARITGRFYAPPLTEPTVLTVCVESGRVVGVERGGRGDIVFDERLLILPGFVDLHVHLRGLRLSYKEDELSGTLAAAAGGVTLVADMPNTEPRLDNVEAIGLKLASLRRNAVVDYGVYAGVPRVPGEASRIASSGHVLGFKVYPEDIERVEELEEVLYEAWRHGLLVVLHSEHPGLLREGCGPGERWKCRSIEAELAALEEITSRAPRGLKLHVTHASSAALVKTAKRMGFSVDVTPHHLLLDSRVEEREGCIAKVNPPLRPPDEREKLLELLVAGMVDAVATDHAPHTVEEKMREFEECPPGIPSLEHYARLMLTLLNRGLLGLQDIVALLSTNPASILGIEGYGCVEPGCVASYTVVDLRREGRILGYETFSKAKLTPYEGWAYRGEPIATIVRGRVVYRDGCICVKPGWGVNAAALARRRGRRGEARTPRDER